MGTRPQIVSVENFTDEYLAKHTVEKIDCSGAAAPSGSYCTSGVVLDDGRVVDLYADVPDPNAKAVDGVSWGTVGTVAMAIGAILLPEVDLAVGVVEGVGALIEWATAAGETGAAVEAAAAVEGAVAAEEAAVVGGEAAVEAEAASAAGEAAAASKRFTDDQAALVDLAKAARRRGASPDDAKTLLDWADEVGLPSRNDIGTDHWDYGDHIHIGPVNHIPVKQ